MGIQTPGLLGASARCQLRHGPKSAQYLGCWLCGRVQPCLMRTSTLPEKQAMTTARLPDSLVGILTKQARPACSRQAESPRRGRSPALIILSRIWWAM